MATLQARLMLVAFVGLAATITYNATFLQSGPHPAPMTVEAEVSSSRLVKTAKLEKIPTKTLPRPTETTAALPRSQTVSALQRKLAENGYEPGPADGVQGHMTMAAIMAYQHDNGLVVTGIASGDLLKHMILGASVGEGGKEDSTQVPEETKLFVKRVQKALAALGYDVGPADGILGASTRKAIEKFERDRKLTVKGRISGHFVKELISASGGSLAEIVSG